jgi:hypothetical protein
MAFRENYMRFKATAIALAVVAAVGYGVYETGELGRQQQAAVPTPAAKSTQTPAPFQSEPTLIAGGTPGDDVRRYIENVGTPGAAFDAYQLLVTCDRAERNMLDDTAEKCAGITPEQRARTGELLVTAMMHGIPGAAAEFARTLMGAPADALAQRRRDNPEFDKAVQTIVARLEESAPRDRDAISVLATLYRQTNAITGQRDAEKALTYVTAFIELRPAPYLAKAHATLVDQLSADLTPQQAARAREAGLKLARQCDCKG